MTPIKRCSLEHVSHILGLALAAPDENFSKAATESVANKAGDMAIRL